MSIAFAVLSGYVLALAAHWLLRFLGWKAGLITSALPLALTAYFVTLVPSIAGGKIVISSTPWVPGLGIALSFYVDGLSLLFALLITGIGTLVLFYSGYYLKGHPYQGRFYAYMLVFMASMLGLVLSGNMILLFVFWELTSISSFLLIGFNHQMEKSRYAAMQALFITTGGGLALLTGAIMIGTVGQDLELSVILTQRDLIQESRLYLPILGLVLAAAFTKSAQFPFHFWLPNAMEAPTPVSAYLHSATMVKAGVYLLGRFSPVIGGTDAWTNTVTVVGAITMVTGAFLALNHWDKKRILAYSTISALGMMVMLLGMGTGLAIKAAVAFLLAHALYKGALFLTAGAVEHETGSRNVNILRGLGSKMPIIAAAGIISGLSLAGIPPLFGFVAKETFFEAARHAGSSLITALAVLSSAALATVAYIVAIRLFFGKQAQTPKEPREPSVILWLSPLVLAFFSLSLGLAPFASNPILTAAASSIRVQLEPIDLALWHGLTSELALSAIAIASGVLIYFAHDHLKRAWREIRRIVFRFSPEYLYRTGIDAIPWLAHAQTKVLQTGYLRNYLSAIFMATVVLVGLTVAQANGYRLLHFNLEATYSEYIIAGAMLAAGIAAALLPYLLSAIVAMGIVGYGVALIYIFFGAPDLAMTQLLVETLTVILFVVGFYHLPPRETKLIRYVSQTRNLIVSISVGALVTVLMVMVMNSHTPSALSAYFADNSYLLADGRNVVNVILVDFRALDTFGETVVLAVAGIGVYMLLKKKSGKGSSK